LYARLFSRNVPAIGSNTVDSCCATATAQARHVDRGRYAKAFLRKRCCRERMNVMLTRRSLLRNGATVALGATLTQGARAQQRNLGANRLVLLGTRGGPAIRTGFTPSPSANLIVWNNVPYVIDTGYGVSFKLVEAKFPLPALRYTFITHHHSDHNAE